MLNSKEQKPREREREYSQFLCVEKYGLNGINDIKFIQNKLRIRRGKIQDSGNDEV